MKILNDISCIILFFLVACFAAGCQREIQVSGGTDRLVSICLCPETMSVVEHGTKAVDQLVDEGLSTGYEVEDFWLFEYDEDGNLLGTPRYYLSSEYEFDEPVPVSVIVPSSSGVEYKAVVIANTHDSSLLSEISYNTLSALKSSAFDVRSYDDLYQTAGDQHDLLMNGIMDITSSTSSVNCMLYRNVAKLKLTIINQVSSGIAISSVQIKSVPDRIYLADRLYDGEAVSPDADVVGFRSMERDVCNIVEGQETTIEYYLPRNMRGTNSSTTESGKNVNAPDNATYVELSGVRTASRIPVVYKFFVGANNINDFNIEPNHLYNVVLDFSVFGDRNDNRVEDMSVVKLEESNSYMINPSLGPVKYLVPIENRINTYWSSESGRKNPDWQKYLVNSEKEWVAEILWTDIEGNHLLFIDDKDNTSAIYSGRKDDRYFSFLVDSSAPAGNVLIGVRRAGSVSDPWTPSEGYMWSWHIWVTDYDPNVDMGVWQDNKYLYELERGNGSLHRYSSFDAIPMYRNRYIMDRNLGAKGYTESHGYVLCTGMMYQYGRKDPFPPSDTVGDVTIEKVSAEDKQIYDSVLYPTTYYKKGGDGDWTIESDYYGYSWNDLNKEVVSGQGKSFFDPCPPGWQLPANTIWNEFGTSTEAYSSRDFNSGKSDAGWMLYLDGSRASAESVYFPASGMRERKNGNYTGGGTQGSMWSASEGNGSFSIYLYYSNSGKNFIRPSQNTNYRAMGLPVRCITDN